jgi:hypothetical protein
MGTGAMLPEKHPLPRPEIALTTFDGDRQRRQREDRTNVRCHVVRALGVMAVRGITVGHQLGRELFQVTANRRIRVLADDQRCARMVDEEVTETLVNPRSFDSLLNLSRDLVSSAAPGFDRQLLPVHDGGLRGLSIVIPHALNPTRTLGCPQPNIRPIIRRWSRGQETDPGRRLGHLSGRDRSSGWIHARRRMVQ